MRRCPSLHKRRYDVGRVRLFTCNLRTPCDNSLQEADVPIRFDGSFPTLESRNSSIFSSFIVVVSYLFGNSQHFWPGFTAHPNHGWQPKATILLTGSFIDFLHFESVKFANLWRRWKHRFENNRGWYTYWLCDQSLTAAERWVRKAVNRRRPKRQTQSMIKIISSPSGL